MIPGYLTRGVVIASLALVPGGPARAQEMMAGEELVQQSKCCARHTAYRISGRRTCAPRRTRWRTCSSHLAWSAGYYQAHITVPAYSVLAYGQSPRPDSPYHTDQAEMFTRGEMKRVAFSERDVDAQLVERYRPGAARQAGGR